MVLQFDSPLRLGALKNKVDTRQVGCSFPVPRRKIPRHVAVGCRGDEAETQAQEQRAATVKEIFDRLDAPRRDSFLAPSREGFVAPAWGEAAIQGSLNVIGNPEHVDQEESQKIAQFRLSAEVCAEVGAVRHSGLK